jgi:SAM-dependent methyltransferase
VQGRTLKCTNSQCKLSREGFPWLSGQPALIDFDASVVDRAGLVARAGGPVQDRDAEGKRLTTRARSHLQRLLFGQNETAKKYALEFNAELNRKVSSPRILIIGGGTIGLGSAALYENPDNEIISLDIYSSRHTTFVADGHKLPLADQCVDGVWIQAVLEHVLEPAAVVDEIHRVLKPDGIVFADTPFMQQVHEGAYDFTRYTLNGQRWLFRRFTIIDAGFSAGAGSSLVWSLRYFIRALTRSNRASTLLSLAVFWLRLTDRFLDDEMNADAASGIFLFGRRSDTSITPKDVVRFNDELRRIRAARAKPAIATEPPAASPVERAAHPT